VPIYLIRHAESEGNAARAYQGRMDTALTPRGEEQARTLGRWLKRQGLECDAVYCSPLRRATRTAQIVAAEAELPQPQPEPLIQEYHVGELEGLSLDAIEERWPGFNNRPPESRGDFSEFGGESYDGVQERLRCFIEGIYTQFTPERSVLAVGHGGSFYQLLKLWCGWPAPRHFFTRMGNCCCFKLGLLTLHAPNAQRAAQLEWMVPLELMEAG
jgi:broad specificity phosphatase PhoE